MKKLSRIVTLFLALALVLSMSAVALADNTSTSGEGENECVVKIVSPYDTPFATWSYPAEIKIRMVPPTEQQGEWTAESVEDYKIVVSDAAIMSGGNGIGFFLRGCDDMGEPMGMLDSMLSVTFSGAPLDGVTVKFDGENGPNNTAVATDGSDYIDDRFENGNWEIPITITDPSISNSFDFDSLKTHVIDTNADLGDATIAFVMKFSANPNN